MLPQLDGPALIIAAGRDHLTPPRVAQQMARAMRNATYRELPQATHFALIEQPRVINEWLLSFARAVFAPSAAPQRDDGQTPQDRNPEPLEEAHG